MKIGVNEISDELYFSLTEEQRDVLENTDEYDFSDVLYSMLYDDVILDENDASDSKEDYYGNISSSLSEKEIRTICNVNLNYNYC